MEQASEHDIEVYPMSRSTVAVSRAGRFSGVQGRIRQRRFLVADRCLI